MLRGLLLVGVAVLGGCLDVIHTQCGDYYCAAGQVCSPDETQCVFPEQLTVCNGLTEGAFCTYTGVPLGACTAGVCVSQTSGSLSAPESLTASDGSSPDLVELSWTAVDGATGYRVWRDSVAITDVTTTSFEDTGAASGGPPIAPPGFAAGQGTSLADVQLSWSESTVANGTTHTYFVTALASSVQSPPSPNDTGFRGAYVLTGYELSIDNGATYTDLGAVNAHTDTTAPPGTWTATVNASDATAGKVALAITGVTEVPAQRAYLLRAVSGGGQSLTSAATGYRGVGQPDSYQWQVSDASAGTYADLGGATGTTYDDTSGPVELPRFYRCAVTGTNGVAATLGPDSGTRKIETPLNLVASNGTSTDEVALAWDPVVGATSYRVYRGGTALTPDVTATSFDDTTATAGSLPSAPGSFAATQGTLTTGVGMSWNASTSTGGTTLTYTVVAIANGNASPQSASDTGFRAPYPVTDYEVSVDGGTTYSSVGAVTSYSDTSAPVGTWTATASASDGGTSGVSLSVTSITAQPVPRSYAVRAVNALGAGSSATATGSRGVGNPTGYQWQWSDTATGTFTDLAGATSASYNETNGPVETIRFYRCMLSGANGAAATIGPDMGNRTLAAPGSLAASDGTSSAKVALTWGSVYGAEFYRVFRNGTFLADVSTTTYDDTDASPGSAPTTPTNVSASQGTLLSGVSLSWTGSTSTAGATESYTVRAFANGTLGPVSTANSGYRSAYPITGYEISFDGGLTFTNVGVVTSYTDTTAPVGGWTAAVAASDSTQGAITLVVNNIFESFSSRTYALRGVSGGGSSGNALVTGYRDVGNPTGYQWQRSDMMMGPFADVSGATTASSSDTTAPVYTTLYYQVVLTGQNGATSTIGSDTGSRVLVQPTNLVASNGTAADKVSLTWNTTFGATGYRVYRGGVAIADVATNAYDDTGAPAGGAPGTPSGFSATDGTYTDHVQVSWNAVGSTAGASQTYTVAALAGTNEGPASASDAGFRGAYPVTYELDINGAGYVSQGSATSYSDTAAPAGAYGGTISASDGKQGKISLSVALTGGNGTTQTYSLRAVNTSGTATAVSDTGYRSAGTASYQWQRSASTTNGSFANIAGATTAAYDDLTSFPTFEQRWYQVIVTTAGGGASTLGPDPGWRGLNTAKTPVWLVGGRLASGVTSSAIGNGVLYVGGDFSYVGPKTGTFSKMSASGTGAADTAWPEFVGNVNVAVSDGSNGWYVGGSISSVGGTATGPLVHVTSAGVLDTSFAPTIVGSIRAIAVSGTTLYIGGLFSSVGGQTRTNIAAVSSTTGAVTAWYPTAGASLQVSALTVIGSKLYVGGQFGSIGGAPRDHLAALDMTTAAVDTWKPDMDGNVDRLGVNGTTLYVEGGFHTVGGVTTRNYLAAFDTSTGSLTSWNPNPSSFVNAMTVVGSTVYVGGGFTSIGGQSRFGLAAVDGTTGNATVVSVQASNVSAIAVVGNTVYVGYGSSTVLTQSRANLFAVDISGGSSGTLLPWDPGCIEWAGDVLVSNGTSVFLGGTTNSVGGVTRNKLAAIDLTTGVATSWNPDVQPTFGGNSVEAIALSSDSSTLYFGGTFTTVGGQARSRLASVSATGTGTVTTWNPGASATVRSLAVSGSTVYVGGDFATIGGVSRSRIAALDGSTGAATSWAPGADSSVRTIYVSGSTVYAGGDFVTLGGALRNKIGAIDASTGLATSWDPSANSTVRTMLAVGSTLFVGGAFTMIGGQSRTRIAELSLTTGAATSWSASVFSDVCSIASSGHAIYYGTFSPTVVAKDLTNPSSTTDWSVTPIIQSACTLRINGTRLWVGFSRNNTTDSLAAYDP